MIIDRFRRFFSPYSADERRRRRREAVIIVLVIITVGLLTYIENRVIHFGADFPVSNTILMFILININLLLLLLLLFLVFRNLVKLLYERQRRVMGARLRTRLVVAFMSLTLLPTIILFFFSIHFITTSIEFWFNVPVEQALENSLVVGQKFYTHIEKNNLFFQERIAYQIISKKMLESANQKALARYIKVVQQEFNLHAVEVYTPQGERMTMAAIPELENLPLETVGDGELFKAVDTKGFQTITTVLQETELIRTISTVPYNLENESPQAYVAVTIRIPSELAQNMAAIAKGFDEYQQIKLLKKPIQITYYIALSIVAFLVMFCALWFGFYLAKSITIPIMELAEGTRRVAEGDLGFSIGLVADDEIGSLVESFNKMTRDLRSSREQLQLSAHKLSDQNIEIEKRRQYMEIVLKNVSAGVITLDASGLVSTINKSAEKMLNLKADEILNKSYKNLLGGQLLSLAKDIIEQLNESSTGALALPLRLVVDGRPRSFMAHVNALKDDVGKHMGIVMVFDDLTELEKAQRMAAWREVARRIAHEVKNPLTPIKLSAQRLRRKYLEQMNDAIFEECTRIIIDHVDLIRNLVNEFSAFARFPTANPQPCELPPIIEETLALYREGHPGVVFESQNDDTIPTLNIDRQQIKQAMINLVENAVAAVKGQGQVSISLTHDPILKMVRIEVTDTGSGVSDEDKTRLFEPYFSTKKAGMGLGLAIVSTIVADHFGMIRVQDNHPRGAKFVIELPA